MGNSFGERRCSGQKRPDGVNPPSYYYSMDRVCLVDGWHTSVLSMCTTSKRQHLDELNEMIQIHRSNSRIVPLTPDN